MTKILDLPRDLVMEIVSRVPLKSLRAVKLTCKNWNTLSKSESFMHIGKTVGATRKGEFLMIAMMHHDLYLMSVVDSSTEVRGKLTCLEEQVKVHQVFHCEGSLLCILKDDPRVVVWNPYCGETRWICIKPRFPYNHPKGGMWSYTYALGYMNNKKKSRRSHKILRFFDFVRPGFFWYEIYDFDSDLWENVDVTPHWMMVYNGVSLKGNTYWCARESMWISSVVHIIYFDFTRKIFGPLLPFPFTAGNDGYVTLSCVREEKLSALFRNNITNEINIWITTKIEAAKLSWSKFLTLDFHNILICGGFYIDEEKKVAVVFDKYGYGDTWNPRTVKIIGDDGYFREFDLGICAHPDFKLQVCSYVPSLGQIKQPDYYGLRRRKITPKRNYDELAGADCIRRSYLWTLVLRTNGSL